LREARKGCDGGNGEEHAGSFRTHGHRPGLLFALGEGAVVPLIPVIAADLGAPLALAGLIAAMIVVGELCGNLPAGWMVARAGERITMILAGSIALLGIIGLAFAPNLVILAVSVFVVGFCTSAYELARHAIMTIHVPLGFRARALSILGGTFRLGIFLGPFVAALLLTLTGQAVSAIWFFAFCVVAGVLLVTFGPDIEKQVEIASVPRETAGKGQSEFFDSGKAVTGGITLPEHHRSDGVFRTMVRHRRVLARLGSSAAMLSAVRAARQVVLPVWGLSLGMDAHTIAVVVGISGALDFALFYASGQVMDRFGRLWASLPSMLLMGLGFLALALSHGLSGANGWFVALAAVIGIGNGLSSGILMTLGADLAPAQNPAPFLSSWRTLSSAGGAVAPVLFSGLTALLTIGPATAVVGVIGLAGAFGFGRYVPRYIPHPRR